MSSFLDYLKTFTLAGLTVTGISYLGNNYNPLAAGILSGIPISIPSMLLIHNLKKQKSFISSATIMVAFLAVITALCWFLLVKLNMSPDLSVAISFTSWGIGAFIYYLIISHKK